MNISEALFLLSSALVLPAVAVLLGAYLNGSLTASENTRYVVLLDPEEDYWTQGVAPRDDGSQSTKRKGGRQE